MRIKSKDYATLLLTLVPSDYVPEGQARVAWLLERGKPPAELEVQVTATLEAWATEGSIGASGEPLDGWRANEPLPLAVVAPVLARASALSKDECAAASGWGEVRPLTVDVTDSLLAAFDMVEQKRTAHKALLAEANGLRSVSADAVTDDALLRAQEVYAALKEDYSLQQWIAEVRATRAALITLAIDPASQEAEQHGSPDLFGLNDIYRDRMIAWNAARVAAMQARADAKAAEIKQQFLALLRKHGTEEQVERFLAYHLPVDEWKQIVLDGELPAAPGLKQYRRMSPGEAREMGYTSPRSTPARAAPLTAAGWLVAKAVQDAHPALPETAFEIWHHTWAGSGSLATLAQYVMRVSIERLGEVFSREYLLE